MFREKVSKMYGHLSPSYRRIADYLLDHHNEAAFMTATQLARQIDVNTATVVRFAQRLGYDGYPELLQDVRSIVRSRLATRRPAAPSGENTYETCVQALEQETENLKQLATNLPSQEVMEVVNALRSARTIYVAGEGRSRDLAHMLLGYLRTLGLAAQEIETDVSSAALTLRNLSPDDVVVAVALDPQCPDTTSVVRLARERNAQTIAIVGALSWPVSRAAKIGVACPIDSIVGVASPVAMSALLSAVFQALWSLQGPKMEELTSPYTGTMQRLADIRAETPLPPM